MENKTIDKRAVKIAKERLVREFNKKDEYIDFNFRTGYKEAIFDFLWDYTGSSKYIEELIKELNLDRRE